MFYYQFNIGDYTKSTHHLSDIEDLAYRRLLDLAYDTEKPLDLSVENLARLIRLKNNLTETQQILDEYFIKTKNGYIQKRVKKELDKYSSKVDAARKNGKKGGRPKKTQSVNSANPKQTQTKTKQETKNTLGNNKITPEKTPVYPEKLNVSAWQEYLTYRKKMKMKKLLPESEVKKIEEIIGFGSKAIQQQAIDQTISNGWTGIFPPKANGGSNGQGDNQSKAERHLDAIRNLPDS